MAVDHSQFIENLRYLLWCTEPEHRDRWDALITKWCQHKSAPRLLVEDATWVDNVEPLAKSVAEATDRIYDEVLHSQLVAGTNILQHNIDYLVAGLDHGQRGEFAKAIGVDVSTISRWRRGKLKPSSKHLQAIQRELGLAADVDLGRQPLFLSVFPVSHAQRRDWLKRQVDELPMTKLNELFPALRLLLGGRNETD